MPPKQSLDEKTSDALAAVAGLAGEDWDFADLPAEDTVHALHPYPAKFIPQIPRRLVEALSLPGELVLDPFSGGGTTAVEALSLGRRFHGIDANPLAVQLGRAKTTVLSDLSLGACVELCTGLAASTVRRVVVDGEAWRPLIPNNDKWYAPEIFEFLVALRQRVMAVEDDDARAVALLIFANVAAKASHQESETRYVSKPRDLAAASVLAQFVRDMQRAARLASQPRYAAGATATFAQGDAKDRSLYPAEVSLAVTSPPYPNSFDYHLYHRFRLFWLGPGPASLRSKEIGSHLKHQSEKDPAGSYSRDMREVLANVRLSLVPGGHFALVVGDGIYKGVAFETSVRLAELAAGLGYEVASVITRQLPVHRRSVTSAGRRLQQEQILVLRKPAPTVFVAPNYGLFPYEEVLASREAAVLTGQVASRLSDAHGSSGGAVRAAFAHGFRVGDDEQPTSQYRMEGSPTSASRKKNSTYLTHGLHRYKGKFYPQLAKALLNVSGLRPEDRVIDPFGGSGTVALEANLLGASALSLDCNPVAVSVARAKTDVLHIGQDATRAYLTGLVKACERPTPARKGQLKQFVPDTVAELESWFPVPVLVKLDALLAVARAQDDPRLVNLGQALISDVVRDVSQQEPADLRIRRRASAIDDAPVYEVLRGRVEALLGKLNAYWHGARGLLPDPGTAAVVLGDSARASSFPAVTAQAVVSSPPYAAALPYIDTDRLSLAAVYGYTGRARKALETVMIGSREVTTRERRSIEQVLTDDPGSLVLPDSTLTFLTSYLDAVRADDRAGFRRQQAPAVLTRYFQAMSLVLANVVEHLGPGSDIWLVLGDSRSVIGGTNWKIPTVDEVYAIGKHRGLEMVESIPITVTRENVIHAKNTIVDNQILHLRTAR